MESVDIPGIQAALQKQNFDAWLFCDFKGSDPIAYSVLGLDPQGHHTRRWYYLIPKQGEPQKLIHRIEPHALAQLPGDVHSYGSWKELASNLKSLLAKTPRVAMQYSPMNAIPYVSRVDAGTVELVQSCGVEVASSQDLLQVFEALLSEEEYQSHLRAGEKVSMVLDEAFEQARSLLASGKQVNEYELQQFMLGRYADLGLVSDYPPVVAVGPNSANPHYMPSEDGSLAIKPGDFLLIDTWAKLAVPGSIYFDVTWVAFLGASVPKRIQEVFEVVRDARDAAIKLLQDRVFSESGLCAYEIDDVVRKHISHAGFGEFFIHRTGHSIHTEVHGNGANIDNFETKDSRKILPQTLFSIEPGIYLPGEFGVRSEVDVFVSDSDVVVTVREPQMEVLCLE